MNFKKSFKSLQKVMGALTLAGASLGAQAQSTGVVQPAVQGAVNNSLSALTPLLNKTIDIDKDIRVGVGVENSGAYGYSVRASVSGNIDQLPGSALSAEVASGANTQEIYGKFAKKLGNDVAISAAAQYLKRNKEFDFASGRLREWVDQVAYGVGATIVQPGKDNLIKSVDAQIYAVDARPKDVGAKDYIVNSSSSYGLFTDPRRLAGSNTTGISLSTTVGNSDNTIQATGTVGIEKTQLQTVGYTPSTTRTVGGIMATYRPTETSIVSLEANNSTDGKNIGTIGYASGYGKISYSNVNGGTVHVGLEIPLGRDAKNIRQNIFTPNKNYGINAREIAERKSVWLPKDVYTNIDTTATPKEKIVINKQSLPAGITIDEATGDISIVNNGNMISTTYLSSGTALSATEAQGTVDTLHIYTGKLKQGNDTIVIQTSTKTINIEVKVGSIIITGISVLDKNIEGALFDSTDSTLTQNLLTVDQSAGSLKCKTLNTVSCTFALLSQSTPGAFTLTSTGDIKVANTAIPAGNYSVRINASITGRYGTFILPVTKTITVVAATNGVDAPTTITLSAGSITTTSILAACNITDTDGASGVCSLRTSTGTLIDTWTMGTDKSITGLVPGTAYILKISGTKNINNPNFSKTAVAVDQEVNFTTVAVNTAPTVTLTGSASITLAQGATYTEQGATWSDAQDGSGAATISGTVNTAVAGTYTITYSKTDAGGLTASATRTVIVSDPMPTGSGLPDVTVSDMSGAIPITPVNAGGVTDTLSRTITYSATGLPLGLSINSSTGSITGTYDNESTMGGISENFNISVTATPTGGTHPFIRSFILSIRNDG